MSEWLEVCTDGPPPTCRNGQPLKPLANALLPGDLVTFSVGDRIPADIRLITAVSLEIDESALTGETRPARKNTDMCGSGEGEDTHGEGGGKALGERRCMAFMGTLVRSGEYIVSGWQTYGTVKLTWGF